MRRSTRRILSARRTERLPVAGTRAFETTARIEDAPGIAEERRAVDGEAGQEFQHEDRQDEAVEHDQHRPVGGHHLGGGLKPQRDGIDDDQEGDGHFETARFDQRLESGHGVFPNDSSGRTSGTTRDSSQAGARADLAPLRAEHAA